MTPALVAGPSQGVLGQGAAPEAAASLKQGLICRRAAFPLLHLQITALPGSSCQAWLENARGPSLWRHDVA